MTPRGTIRHLLRAAPALAIVVMACSGPSNPEPIMLNTQVISILGAEPGSVNVMGEADATSGAVRLRTINLDGLVATTTQVNADGSFELLLPGLPEERYRLVAEASDGRFATAVVTTDGVTPDVMEIDEAELGCLRAEPAYLDLGEAAVGEPVYGEVTVINDCPDPQDFMNVSTDSPVFTTASLLQQGWMLEPGMSATVSITYLSPGGEDEALLMLEPTLIGPEQTTVVVALRGRAD